MHLFYTNYLKTRFKFEYKFNNNFLYENIHHFHISKLRNLQLIIFIIFLKLKIFLKYIFYKKYIEIERHLVTLFLFMIPSIGEDVKFYM